MYLILTEDVNIVQMANVSKETSIMKIPCSCNKVLTEDYQNQYEGKFKSYPTENQIIDLNCILMRLGIPPHVKGFEFIKTYFKLVQTNENFDTEGLTTVIYPEIAKIHNSTSSRVERAMRHSISIAEQTGTPLFKKLFENNPKITNACFLRTLSIFLKDKGSYIF